MNCSRIIVDPEIEIQSKDDVINIIELAVAETLGYLDFDAEDYIVDITIMGNDNIRLVNLKHRNIDRPTDVLSFPMYNFHNSNTNDTLERDPEIGRVFIGDIVISYEMASEHALDYGHSIVREMGFLVVHSMLHLFGYDHEGDEMDKVIMRACEKEILKNMNLTRD